MKLCPFSRVAWISVLVYTVTSCFAHVALAQDLNWEKKWDPGIRDRWFKDDKTNPKKPTHRLAPVCPECQSIADELQKALDDWYLLQYADGEQIRKDGLKNQNGDQQKAGNACKENALAGLGGLTDKEAQAKLPKPPKKGDKEAPKPLPDKKTQRKKIDDLAQALQACLDEKCPLPGAVQKPAPPEKPKGGGEEQPTDGGKQGGGGEEWPPAPPKFDIQIPKLPDCFQTEQDRKDYRKKLEELVEKVSSIKKYYAQYLSPPIDAGWKEFGEKVKKARDDINDQIFRGDDGKDKIDKVPICPKGGGTGKGKTPGQGKPKAPPKVRTGGNVSLPSVPGETFAGLISDGKITVETTGTGETIGVVAYFTIQNLTDSPIEDVIPALILESRTRKYQDYACCKEETFRVAPGETITVPIDGLCVARNKRPVGKGVTGDLIVNTGDPTVPQNPDSHLSAKEAGDLKRIAKSKCDAVDKLEKDGAFKDFPYPDKKKRKNIVEQWTIWSDERICEITGAPPATKDDFKKVIYKQVEGQHGPMTPDIQKKVDKGADTMWDGIELASVKAKDLEEPAQDAETEMTGTEGQGNTFEISDRTDQTTGTPTPGTQEKPKKKDKGKKGNWPKPIQDWVDKKKAAVDALFVLEDAKEKYRKKLQPELDKSKRYKELKDARDKAKEKANGKDATAEDKDNLAKAQKELDKVERDLEKDYQQTAEGKEEYKKVADAEKEANKADAAEKEAGKNIDPETKKDIWNEDYVKDLMKQFGPEKAKPPTKP